MDRPELLKQFATNMTLLKHGMHARMLQLTQSLSLTRSQFELLATIHHTPRATVKNLSKQFSLTPGAISQLVEQVVQQGYIARAPDPEDRRTILLSLTTAGDTLIQKLERERTDILRVTLASLTDDELAAMVTAQKKLVTALQAIPPEGYIKRENI